MSSISTRVAVFDANEIASQWMTQWAAETATEIVLFSHSVDQWVAQLPLCKTDVIVIDRSAERSDHSHGSDWIAQLRCPEDIPVIVLVSSEAAATHLRDQLFHGLDAKRLTQVRVVAAPVTFRELSVYLELALAVQARTTEHDFATHIVGRIAQGISVTDKDGRFEFANKSYADLFGWTPEMLIGRTPEYVTVESCQEHLAEQLALRRAGKTTTYESMLARPDGSEVPVSITATPRFVDGKFAGSIAVITDLSERKVLEHALQTEREFALQVVSRMGQGVAVTDAAGIFRYVNPALAKLLGSSPDLVVGRPTTDCFVEEDRAAQELEGARRLRGETSTYSAHFLRPDGVTVPVSITSSPLVTGDRFDGAIAVIDDLRERIRWQNALEAERDFATQVLETVGQGLSVSNQDGVLEYINPALAQMFGISPEEAVGRGTDALFVPEDVALVHEQRRLRLSGKTSTYEARLKRTGGEPLLVSITSAPRLVAGKFTGVISAVTDLSARREAELALEESETNFRTLIERSPSGIVVHRDGVVLYVNPACVTMFEGTAQSEFVGRNIFDFSHSDDRKMAIARAKEVMATGGLLPPAQFRALTRTGREIQVESQGFRIVYGGAPALCSTLYDVTARAEAAHASQIAQRRSEILGSLARNLSEATDKSAAATHIVEAAQELIGWDASWLRTWNADAGTFERVVDFDTYGGQILPLAESAQKNFRPSPIILKVISEGPQILLRDSPDEAGARDYLHGNGQPSMSLLFAPISRGEELIGVLSVQSYRRHAYDTIDLDLLNLLAAHCGGAMARLQGVDALQESEARFKYAIDATEDGIWDWNIIANTVYFSPQWKRLLGYLPEEVPDNIGFFFSSIHPDDVQQIRTAVDDHLAGLTPMKMSEVRLKTKDGSYRWFSDRGKTVAWTAEGKPARMVGTITDITAQKIADTNLQDSERRYRALVEWSPEAVVVHRNGRLVYANPAFIKLVGASSAEEALKPTLIDYVHPEHKAIAIARMQAIAAGAATAPLLEMRGMRLDGTDMFVETQGTVIAYDGAPAVHVVVRDITQRRAVEVARAALEAQLLESQKMQAIGTLAGGIAHDFNNVLAIILGNVELASQDAGQDGREQESLREIRKAATRARNLVQQILSFSRRQPSERKRISLLPVVAESARLLRATLPARISLDVQVAERVPEVMADGTQIEQVLLNLCANSMQAIGGGSGSIMIRMEVVTIDTSLVGRYHDLAKLAERQNQQMARIVVDDDGPGMTPEVLARIFEPFFTTKPVDEGTGLGLSVVHGIVEGHDGVIVCDSAVGAGAAFTIYLPLAEPAATAGDSRVASVHPAAAEPIGPPANEAIRKPNGELTVFYVDDDESLVFLIERLLTRQGFRVRGFTLQEDALEELGSDPNACDILVTDYNMPGMSGLDVARAALKLRPALPIVVASGFVDERLREQADESGVSRVILKASAVSDLSELLVETIVSLRLR
jgi:two-component system, cell cycle sensor histidine kinase and response regulator CckA